jgi:hypothetical protein
MTTNESQLEDRGAETAPRYSLSQRRPGLSSAHTRTELPPKSAEPQITRCRPTGLGTPNIGARRKPLRALPVSVCTGRRPGNTPAPPLEAGAFGLQSAAVSPNRWGVLAVLRSLIHLLMCSLDQTYRKESLEERSTGQYDPPSGGRSSRQNTAPNSRTQSTTQEVFHVQP